jgi:hypothetical protein
MNRMERKDASLGVWCMIGFVVTFGVRGSGGGH